MKIKHNFRVGQVLAPNPASTDKCLAFTTKNNDLKPIKTVGGRCAGY